MATKLIVGLGNPGPKYLWTRHNAGFIVLDRFTTLNNIPVTKKSFSGLYGEGNFANNRLLLLKPQTYMNISGRAVAEALRFHKLLPSDIIVIHDDLDISYGQVRIKENGGHGGHNGLRSIHQEIGSDNYIRIRIGIGHPTHGDAADYVLTPFDKSEMPSLPAVVDSAVDALETLLREDVKKAMTLFNNRNLISRKDM
ncbi:MAG: aminoacyl-tRNA hydrolase [Desulfuromonadales bacterium]|nr:aminoacyl-tRNA hydrolase [Desulfuromonadales bacterium]